MHNYSKRFGNKLDDSFSWILLVVDGHLFMKIYYATLKRREEFSFQNGIKFKDGNSIEQVVLIMRHLHIYIMRQHASGQRPLYSLSP